jgi:hypothetical protein
MIDQLYQDFTTKLLPQIQAGVEISKEYFMDLFERYVNYLILTDAIKCGIGLIMFIGGIIVIYKFEKYYEKQGLGGGNGTLYFFIILMGIIGLIGFILDGLNLIKDIYIPEIRIWEILSGMI